MGIGSRMASEMPEACLGDRLNEPVGSREAFGRGNVASSLYF